MPDIRIVPTAPEHRAAWGDLYRNYAAFYEVEQSEAMRDTVWNWLQDPVHEVKGLLALDESGRPVGLAHYRPFARPLAATYGGFLDDLFVTPQARGSGAGSRLIEAVAEIGRQRGWSVIRWITAEDNVRARRVYDRIASKTRWITYDIGLG